MIKLKLFLDTNVFLDSFLNRDSGEAKELLKLIVNNSNIDGFLSDLSIANIYYIAQKELGRDYIKDLIRFLLKNFKIVSIDEDIIENALNSNFKDFEDALQYFVSKRYSCNYIITKNIKDFKNSNIKVHSAKEFLNLYNQGI